MKIIFSILINAWILWAMWFFLQWDPTKGLPDWVIISPLGFDMWQTLLLGWVILWIMNVTIRPIIKILALPFFLVFWGFVVFLINGVMLYLFNYIINQILNIPGMSYQIDGTVNFIIAVAIFTILNMFYSSLFNK